MSKYFEGVDFPELRKEKASAEPVPDAFPDDFEKYLVEFRRMLQAIEEGQSAITRGAINLTKAPVKAALERLAKAPGAATLRMFLDMSQQDINLRARREFLIILNQNKKVKAWIDSKIPGANI